MVLGCCHHRGTHHRSVVATWAAAHQHHHRYRNSHSCVPSRSLSLCRPSAPHRPSCSGRPYRRASDGGNRHSSTGPTRAPGARSRVSRHQLHPHHRGSAGHQTLGLGRRNSSSSRRLACMHALFAFICSVFLLLFFLVVANTHAAGTS
jgi:hypothetical protein